MGYSLLSKKKHKQMLFYKMINGLCPDYLSSLFPPTVGNNTAYNLRNASDYKYIRSNTLWYYNSFLPSVVRDWNELPHTTRNAPSNGAFKRSLNSNLISVPHSIWMASALVKFIILEWEWIVALLITTSFQKTSLTVRFAFVVDQKLPKHYLFDCNRFNNLRQEMMPSISQLCERTLNALLYSHRSFQRHK